MTLAELRKAFSLTQDTLAKNLNVKQAEISKIENWADMLMPPTARVTVTMPGELVAGIDRIEGNRSRFITEAVRHELQRRQRQELLRSLEAPHPDSATTAALGLADWTEALPEGDNDLLDPNAGVAVHWRQDSGWQETNAPETRP